MKDPLESDTSLTEQAAQPRSSHWLGVGVIAAASALAGGIAAAWFYRKTLAQLRQAEGSAANPEFRPLDGDLGEDD